MKKNAENAEDFYCKVCDFKCFKLSNWTKHNSTRKHQTRTLLNEKMPENAKPKFACKKCNKSYGARNSLWYHENKCNMVTTPNSDIIDRLLNENQRILDDNAELRNFIIEQSKLTSELVNKALDSNKIVNSNNTINNKFNINLFLNEQCKDALNFNEFMENIQISYQDLENNAQLGFVAGISKIFLDNLNQLGINERPIHCTDVKRETMYIKDENKWTKEPDDSKLQKAIQSVSYKSMGKLMEWKQENPEYQNADSEFSKRCLDMQKHTLAGSERDTYYPKVIHTLARETMVDK